jgi:predicted DNA-binding WGR domain protein
MPLLLHIDPTKNMQRFYRLQITPTLFGEWSLMREWGRIGSPGRLRCDSFASEAEARAAARVIIRIRARHGYIDSV